MADTATRPQPADSVTVFGFSARVRNCLARGGIATVADLLDRSHAELMDIRAFGPTCLREVVDALAARGLRLPELPEPPTPEQNRAVLAALGVANPGVYDT